MIDARTPLDQLTPEQQQMLRDESARLSNNWVLTYILTHLREETVNGLAEVKPDDVTKICSLQQRLQVISDIPLNLATFLTVIEKSEDDEDED